MLHLAFILHLENIKNTVSLTSTSIFMHANFIQNWSTQLLTCMILTIHFSNLTTLVINLSGDLHASQNVTTNDIIKLDA